MQACPQFLFRARPFVLVYPWRLSTSTITPPLAHAPLSAIPIFHRNPRLPENLSHERPINVPRMGIRNAHLECTVDHVLVSTAGMGAIKAKCAELADQFPSRDRVRHALRGLNSKPNPPKAWNRITITKLQDQPFFEDLLQHHSAFPQCALVRPDPGQPRNLAKAGAIVKALKLRPTHRLLYVARNHSALIITRTSLAIPDLRRSTIAAFWIAREQELFP